MTFTERHTHEAFLLACDQLEDMTEVFTMFDVLANPDSFDSEARALAKYLDSWDCWLFTDEVVQLLAA